MALIPREAVISNTNSKRERILGLIRFEADLVLDNDCTFAVTMSNLLRFAEGIRTKC